MDEDADRTGFALMRPAARDRDGGRQKIKADALILALRGAPDSALEQSLRAIDGLEVHVIGEASGTRLIGEVIHDGARVGRAI